MRYFLDTEFYEDGRTIDLISIGLVAEDGREFYACSLDAQLHRCHERDSWMRENVLAQLPSYGDKAWMSRQKIRQGVTLFTGSDDVRDALVRTVELDTLFVRDDKPEIWAWYGASDWVTFYQLWGRLIDMPRHFPRRFRELKELADRVVDPALPPKPQGQHTAIADARWNRDVFNYLAAQLPGW
jgi:hypothetical protein